MTKSRDLLDYFFEYGPCSSVRGQPFFIDRKDNVSVRRRCGGLGMSSRGRVLPRAGLPRRGLLGHGGWNVFAVHRGVHAAHDAGHALHVRPVLCFFPLARAPAPRRPSIVSVGAACSVLRRLPCTQVVHVTGTLLVKSTGARRTPAAAPSPLLPRAAPKLRQARRARHDFDFAIAPRVRISDKQPQKTPHTHSQ